MENKDFKYVIQDFSTLYIGAKFTYGELIEEEEAPFKLKSIIQKNVLSEMEPDLSLESHFYYMEDNGFIYQIYKQLRVKLKVSEIVEKKSFFGKKKKEYVSKVYSLADFVKIPLEMKKQKGVVISEINMSKLALMGISV